MSSERAPAPLQERFRRRAGAMVVDGFFRGISAAGKLHPKARPERHNIELIRDVAYRNSGLAEHRLDIYRPRDAGSQGPLPVIVYVHGGGFRILSKDTHWIMGLAFARRGYLVFNISYRLAPEHRFPAAIEDACDALAWVVEHAARFGGDPSRLALAGESAGANLVTSLAIATSYRRPEPWARRVFDAGVRPRAVVPACGVFQVTEPERFQRRFPRLSPFIYDRLLEVSDAYLGSAQPHRPGEHDLADPVMLFERGDAPDRPLPPFFTPCGTRDPLVDDTQRLKRALDALGTRCDVELYPGEPHAFHAIVFTPNARRCWARTFDFLDEHMGSARDAEEQQVLVG